MTRVLTFVYMKLFAVFALHYFSENEDLNDAIIT